MAEGIKTSNAIVIGAGIAGVTTALELSKNGYNVTVIERFPLAAQFCSMANACMLRLHTPTPFKTIESQFHSSQALRAFKSLSPTFKPNYATSVIVDPYFFTDITSYKWLYAYTKSQFKKQNQSILDLFDAYCFNAFVSNAKEVGNAMGSNFQCNGGYAQIYPSTITSYLKHTKNLYSALTQTKSLSFDNSETIAAQTEVDNLKIETFPSCFVADCHLFSNHIANLNGKAAMNDITFKFNSKATEIIVDKNNTVCGVTVDNDVTLRADKVVICAGVLTNNIIQNIVYQIKDTNAKQRMKLPYIPIIPLQGFSITLPYSPKNRYKYPYNVMEYFPSHLYASRINDDELRFSAYGYFRNNRYATKVWNNMVDSLESKIGVQDNLKDITATESVLLDNMESCIKDNLLSIYDIDEKYFDENKIQWTGFRPYTPDGLPIVDQVKNINGLYVNSGHGFLGWGTSHGTAKLVRKLMSGECDENEASMLKALSLNRF